MCAGQRTGCRSRGQGSSNCHRSGDRRFAGLCGSRSACNSVDAAYPMGAGRVHGDTDGRARRVSRVRRFRYGRGGRRRDRPARKKPAPRNPSHPCDCARHLPRSRIYRVGDRRLAHARRFPRATQRCCTTIHGGLGRAARRCYCRRHDRGYGKRGARRHVADHFRDGARWSAAFPIGASRSENRDTRCRDDRQRRHADHDGLIRLLIQRNSRRRLPLRAAFRPAAARPGDVASRQKRIACIQNATASHSVAACVCHDRAAARGERNERDFGWSDLDRHRLARLLE